MRVLMILMVIPGTPAWRRRRALERCRAAAVHIQTLVDQELSPTEFEADVRQHVHGCPPCAAEATVIAELKIAIVRVSQRGDAELAERLRRVAIELCDDC
jgi:hypothetical protein